MRFLSTLSLRRATPAPKEHQRPTVISIHALLAESDGRVSIPGPTAQEFLSTLSLRRATTGTYYLYDGINVFLSTLSLRRATAFSASAWAARAHFYPRSPCGERLDDPQRQPQRQHFYPRSPCGERPPRRSAPSPRRYFYPRSPCGERPSNWATHDRIEGFLSTLSLRRATPQHDGL